MIQFNNLNSETPYLLFKTKYDEALNAGQKVIEAISISTYNSKTNEVDSRYVNLKFITNNQFIFFSNYDSPKADAFISNNQIAALVYWPSINVQVRMKAKIKRTTDEFNQNYFFNRSKEKNALAISSNQSKIIDSFDKVQENFKKSLNDDDLKECPKYWGGYSFTPYEIEFWEGNEFRLNKRNLYRKDNTTWNHFILEP
jgi:pyridoxamine 5'-phosphate oxidase